jgi:predicted dehydrogenase
MNRWGFLGTGRVTKRMIEAVRQSRNAVLAGVASRDVSRAAAWAAERRAESHRKDLECVKAYDGYAALLEDPEIDWVYIALPPSLHHRWSMAALAAGKHVLSEKPLCLNELEAKELASFARHHQRLLFHATAFPHHPRSIAAKAVINSGELGGIRRLHVACSFSGIITRGHDHRTDALLGGGSLLDLGWYCVLSTLWFTGLDCTRIRAIGTKRDGVWYQVQALAEMSNGAIAHWDCGFDAAHRRWIEIAGTEASLICDDFLRPLDLSKPRYWIHGQEGKTRTELVGEGAFQEALLIEACQNACKHNISSNSHAEAATELVDQQLELAIKTHHILDCMERSIETGIAITT